MNKNRDRDREMDRDRVVHGDRGSEANNLFEQELMQRLKEVHSSSDEEAGDDNGYAESEPRSSTYLQKVGGYPNALNIDCDLGSQISHRSLVRQVASPLYAYDPGSGIYMQPMQDHREEILLEEPRGGEGEIMIHTGDGDQLAQAQQSQGAEAHEEIFIDYPNLPKELIDIVQL